MIKNLILLFVFFSAGFKLQAQNLTSDQLEMISRNILTYHYRYALYYDLNLKSETIIEGNNYFFNELWPKEGQNLKLNILPTELKYPLEGITALEVRKRGFQIGNDSIRIFKELRSFQADDIYLITIDSSGKEIKFICGNFFLSSVKDDFDLNLYVPETFIDYLKFRTLNWSPQNFKYNRTTKSKLVFSAYSQYLRGDIQIEVDKFDFDKVTVLEKKKRAVY